MIEYFNGRDYIFMKVKKGDIVYNLKDKVQIDAFLGSGWIQVEEMPDDNYDKLSVEKLNAMTDEQLRQHALDVGAQIPGNVSRRETIISTILQHEKKLKESAE